VMKATCLWLFRLCAWTIAVAFGKINSLLPAV
jgi:hypothetical protein